MPDIQTALRSALNEWETPDKPPQQEKPVKEYFKTTTNVSRATFDYVKNNPGLTAKLVVNGMQFQNKDYKESSITSLLGQMVRNDMVRKTQHGEYHALVKEYKALKAAKTLANRRPKQTKKQPAPAGIATLVVETKNVDDIDALLTSLSVKQARALYDELKKIFGG
jgi:hypothetical protein